MFLFFIISVYLSSVYIVSFYKFVFDILSRHPLNLLIEGGMFNIKIVQGMQCIAVDKS